MVQPTDFSENELKLAQLICLKLSKLLEGILSVGLNSLQLDSAAAFLQGRDQLINAALEMLRHTGVKPGSNSAAALNEKTRALSTQVSQFYRCLLRLADWQQMPSVDIQITGDQLSSAYSAALSTVQEVLRVLHITTDYRPQLAKAEILIECTISTLVQHCDA